MMEAQPAAPLIMAETDLLLELLVIALDTPTHFGRVDQASERNVLVDGREPILGRCGFALWPLDQQRLFRACAASSRWRGAHPNTGKARAQAIIAALAPCDRPPGMFRQTERQLLDAHALPQSTIFVYLTHFHRRHDGSHIAKPERADAGAQRAVRAVARIHQHSTTWHTRCQSRADLRKRDLRLGLELDLAWDTRLLAARRIFRPFLRQIQPISDRQAGMMIGDRQRHRHLTIGLLAQLPAVLMMHSHRVAPLL